MSRIWRFYSELILNKDCGHHFKSAKNSNLEENKLANKGYDVVYFFTTNTAKKDQFFVQNMGGVGYYFLNTENLKVFNTKSNKYLPQFEGYSAFAVAKMNKKVDVDPEIFRIDDGKLYLFYNDFWEGKPCNTIIPWLNNEAEMEKMARSNWKTLE